MTTHARGGVFLIPAARAVVDIGALNGARDLHRRARQGARLQDDQPVRLGLGPVPREHRALPRRRARGDRRRCRAARRTRRRCSSICAVLAETDVINMVSRGIATPDILKGIHLSMASRLVKLLKVTGITRARCCSPAGWRSTTGLLAALQEELVNEKIAGLDRDEPPGLDLRRRDRRGAVGRVPPRASSRRSQQKHGGVRTSQGGINGIAHQRRLHRCATPACRCARTKRSSAGDPVYVIDALRCTECVGRRRTSRSASWCARPTASCRTPTSSRRPSSSRRNTPRCTGDCEDRDFQAASWRAMKAFTISWARVVCGPGSATHSCTLFSKSSYCTSPPAAR